MNYQPLKETLRKRDLILLLSFIVMSVSCDSKQDTEDGENIEQTIIELERKGLDRWAQGNPLGMTANFADDMTYFDDIGAHTRLDGLEEIQSYFASLEGKVPPHSYELVDPKVQIYGDIAILTVRYHATNADGEQEAPWKATSVYRLTNGAWQIVHANWSVVKEPEETADDTY